MGRDYYNILGVARDADDAALRAAYKKLALQWHPDRNRNQQAYATDKFKAVAEAYDVLSDPQKRAVYDRFGEEGLKAGVPPSAAAADGPFSAGAGVFSSGSSTGGGGRRRDTHYTGMDQDAAQRLFESLFGGSGLFGRSGGFAGGVGSSARAGGGHGGGGSSGSPGSFGQQFPSFMSPGAGGGMFGAGDGHDTTFTAGVPGSDPFAAFGMGAPGSFFAAHHQQQPQWAQQQAPGAAAFGSSSWHQQQQPPAWRQQQQQQQQQARQWPRSPSPQPHVVALPLTLEELYCGATKRLKVTRHVMDAASGASLPVTDVLEVPVRPGWKEGTRVSFAGKGDEVAPGTAADLVLVVKQAPHARFERRGNDLHTTVQLPLVTALTGGDAGPLVLPDGRRLPLAVSHPPVQPGSSRLVVGEGMPRSRGGGKGDLHVTFEVVFPSSLTAQQKQQLRQVLPAA